MKAPHSRSGFTLIEVLVVAAIISLLVAILLPSLSRARDQTRLVACQSNVRQLGMATQMYVAANRGRFPADSKAHDYGYDWIGRHSPTGKVIPEGGSIWRYMNKARDAYSCPSETRKGNTWWHYSANVMLSGAPAELAVGAHHPAYPPETYLTMNRGDHRVNMKNFDGVPLYAEETWASLQTVTDGEWTGDDGFETRHLKSGARDMAAGTVAYHDGHAGILRLPQDRSVANWQQRFFRADDMCIRTSATKWISMEDINFSTPKGAYGLLAGKGATSKKQHH